MADINTAALKREKKSLRRQKRVQWTLRALVWASAAVTVGVLVALIAYILIMGIPNLSPKLFEWTYTTDNVSMMPAIINTINGANLDDELANAEQQIRFEMGL